MRCNSAAVAARRRAAGAWMRGSGEAIGRYNQPLLMVRVHRGVRCWYTEAWLFS